MIINFISSELAQREQEALQLQMGLGAYGEQPRSTQVMCSALPLCIKQSLQCSALSVYECNYCGKVASCKLVCRFPNGFTYILFKMCASDNDASLNVFIIIFIITVEWQ